MLADGRIVVRAEGWGAAHFDVVEPGGAYQRVAWETLRERVGRGPFRLGDVPRVPPYDDPESRAERTARGIATRRARAAARAAARGGAK